MRKSTGQPKVTVTNKSAARGREQVVVQRQPVKPKLSTVPDQSDPESVQADEQAAVFRAQLDARHETEFEHAEASLILSEAAAEGHKILSQAQEIAGRLRGEAEVWASRQREAATKEVELLLAQARRDAENIRRQAERAAGTKLPRKSAACDQALSEEKNEPTDVVDLLSVAANTVAGLVDAMGQMTGYMTQVHASLTATVEPVDGSHETRGDAPPVTLPMANPSGDGVTPEGRPLGAMFR